MGSRSQRGVRRLAADHRHPANGAARASFVVDGVNGFQVECDDVEALARGG